jgi:hypothetical protein
MPQALARPEFDVDLRCYVGRGHCGGSGQTSWKDSGYRRPTFIRRPVERRIGFTDTGNKAVIGGLSRDFYQRVWRSTTARIVEVAEAGGYGNRVRTPAIDGAQRTMWIFEPHVAERVFEDFVSEYQLRVDRNQWLDRSKEWSRPAAGSCRLPWSAAGLHGRMFIDATYEGDLMAAAGVDYKVGRESQATWREMERCEPGCCTIAHFGVLASRSSLRRARRSHERNAPAHQ